MVVSEQYYTAKPVLVLPATCQGRLCSRPHGGADAVWQLKKKQNRGGSRTNALKYN